MPKGKQEIAVGEKPLRPQHEMFARLYTTNKELFGNATLCYAEVYQYDLDSLSKESIYAEDKKTIIEESEYDKAYRVCSVEGNRLLRNPSIQIRTREYLNEMLSNEFVDSELARAIMQDFKWDTKVKAIGEYNKLKGRIEEKMKFSADKSLTALLDAAAKARNNPS